MSGLVAALMLAGLLPPAAIGAAPDDVIPGWQWHMVSNRDGVPPMVRAITQTPDGYLWLGSYYGIYRFDGVHILPLPPSSEKPLQSSDVGSLLASADGRLWAGHDWGGLSVIQGNSHSIVPEPYLATVSLLRANASGASWAVTANGKQITLARLIDHHWVVWAHQPMDYMTNAAVGRDGSLWFTAGPHLMLASATSHAVIRIPSESLANATLTVDGQGQPWLVTRDSLRRLTFPPASLPAKALGPIIPKPRAAKTGTVVFDGAQDFWAIEDDKLIRRYHIETDGKTLHVTGTWHSPYQLSNPSFALSQTPMFVDREHTLWIGTSRGLLRFSHAAFTLTAPAIASASNWQIPYGVQTDAKGDVWQWHGGKLSKAARDGSMIEQPGADPSIDFAPCRAAVGGVWVARDNHTLMLIGGAAPRTISLSGRHPLSPIVGGDCTEDSRGRLWADQLDGLHLLGPGQQRKVALGEDTGFQVSNMVPLDDGWIAAYVGHGSLWLTDGTRARKLWDEHAVTLGFIEVMVRVGGQLLMGGDRGIARYDGHRIVTLTSRRFPFLATTTGIAQTPSGETWLQTSKGVIHLATADLNHAFDDPGALLHPRIFTMEDGIPGTALFLNMTNVNADRFGHVWVTTDNGIARHDADQHWNLAPPPVVITGLTAGNLSYAPGAPLTLPPGAGRIRIDFTALSFADPSRLRFRYRMSGIDSDWVNPGDERSASYTSLPPGTYTFQVMAANSEGVWNRQGASITLIEPALFWQTWWFRGALAIIAALTGWALYRWRLGIVSRRLREHAAQRAQERERVARDIHDTLLQSIQGLVLRFQSVAGKMPVADPNRELLETTLNRADELIAQGKERVHGLRDDDRPLSLPDLIGEQFDEAPFPLDMERRFTVSGIPVDVHTSVALEIREIVSEALFNAARHAKAGEICVGIDYGTRALEITITDNGIGIPPSAAGIGHGYGLIGMRGRAESIGAVLTIKAGLEGGTRVTLHVPARRAYVAVPSWWRRLLAP